MENENQTIDPVIAGSTSKKVDPFSMELMDAKKLINSGFENNTPDLKMYPIPSMVNKNRVLKSLNDIIESNDIESYNNYLNALKKFIERT